MDYCMLLKYSADEKCYIVTVPDLPGCMADGENPNEAYEKFRNQYLGGINFKGQLLPPLSV